MWVHRGGEGGLHKQQGEQQGEGGLGATILCQDCNWQTPLECAGFACYSPLAPPCAACWQVPATWLLKATTHPSPCRAPEHTPQCTTSTEKSKRQGYLSAFMEVRCALQKHAARCVFHTNSVNSVSMPPRSSAWLPLSPSQRIAAPPRLLHGLSDAHAALGLGRLLGACSTHARVWHQGSSDAA